MEDKTSESPGNTEKQGNSKVQKIWFFNKQGKKIEVECQPCDHCNGKEIVPVIAIPCADCGTPYEHWKTVEIKEGEDAGFLYFIYRCSGCFGNNRKAKKVLKPI